MRAALLLCLLCACAPPAAPDEPGEPTPSTPAHLEAVVAACEASPSVAASAPWSGLLSDAHVHMTIGSEPVDFALALLDDMNELGVDRVVVQVDHFLDLDAAAALDAAWGELVTWCPRLLWLVGGFDPEDPASADAVLARLDEAPYAGVGELNIEHGAGLTVDPDSPSLVALYPELEQRGLALHLQAVNPGAPNWLAMEAQAAAHPDLPIAWFGCSGLFFDEAALPNVACTLFPLNPPNMPTDAATQARHVGRGLLGTDSAPAGFTNPAGGSLPWSDFAGGIAAARAWLAALDVSDEDRERTARGNFDRIFEDRR